MFDAPEKTKIKGLLYAVQKAGQKWMVSNRKPQSMKGEEQLAPLDPKICASMPLHMCSLTKSNELMSF